MEFKPFKILITLIAASLLVACSKSSDEPAPTPPASETSPVPTAPQNSVVSTVNMPASANYTIHQAISFSITFDEVLTVTGSPYISLLVGGEIRNAIYTVGSGTNTLAFNYVIERDHYDNDGIEFASTEINLNSGSLLNNNGVAASLDFTSAASPLTGVLVDARITSLSVSASKFLLLANETTHVTATGTYSDGSHRTLTTEATYSSSDASVLTHSNGTYQATGHATGNAQLDISFGGQTKSLNFSVSNPTLSSLALNLFNPTLASDGSTQLIVTANYQNGQTQDVTNQATFNITDPSIIGITSTGVISALAAGSTNLSADFDGQTVSTNVTVEPKTLSALTIAPLIGSGALLQTQQFFATATYSDGSTANVTSLTSWSSSAPGVLSINTQTGLAMLVTAGSANIAATLSGVSANTTFTVNPKTLTGLTVTLDTSSLALGYTTTATAIGTYSDSSTEDISGSVIWSSSDTSIANINNPSAAITPIAIGQTTITASLGGLSNTALLDVTAATLSSITLSPETTFTVVGENRQFLAKGTFSDSSEYDITEQVVWSSSDNSLAVMSNANGSKGLMNSIYSGGSTVNFDVIAAKDGITQSANVIISQATLDSIYINPNTVSKNVGHIHPLKAYALYSDGASAEVTNLATWSSTDTHIAAVSNSIFDAGTLSPLTEGSAQITASFSGLTSTAADITVSNSAPESSNEVGIGLSASYHAGLNFDTLKGQRIDADVNFSWNAGAAPLGVGDSFSIRWEGRLRAKASGNCTVSTLSDDGIRVYIDGVLIQDDWTNHSARWNHSSYTFTEGQFYNFQFEFYENSGYATVQLHWSCPGFAREVIATEYLYPE